MQGCTEIHGVDVAKDEVVIAMHGQTAVRAIANECTAIDAWLEWLEGSKGRSKRRCGISIHQDVQIRRQLSGTACVQDVVNSFGVLLELEREILHMADESGDDGTSDMMASYIREQEKMVWMYSSFLKT